MGNVHDRDSDSDSDDGEIVYDTLARGFKFKKCNSGSELTKPVAIKRASSVRNSRRRGTTRSVSKKSIKRRSSSKRSNKEMKSNAFLLSDMEVQVDGKTAK